MISEHSGKYEDELDTAGADSTKVADRIIVKTKNEINTYDAVDVVYGLGYAFIQFDNYASAEKALTEYNNQGLIAQNDVVYSLNDTPSTLATDTSEKWAYSFTEADTTVSYFKYKKPSEIVVGLIDSGIEYTHSLLKSRVIRSNVNFSTSGNQNDELDDEGHGTSCAGIIVQSTPSNVKVEGFKAGSGDGHIYTSSLVCTYEYILAMNDKPDVINMSYGGYGEVLDIEKELITEMHEAGIVMVSSAGNENRDTADNYPANDENVIAVAAFDKVGKKCTFSNYGTTVDVAAPGIYLYTSELNNTYIENFAGTSGSAPFVSAAAAIVLMQDTSLTPDDVKTKIKQGAINTGKVSDRMWAGAGLLNFSALIDGDRKSDVVFNYESGEYDDTINIELSSPDKLNTKIIYTTDGTMPSKDNGTTYSNPIVVDTYATITAAAFPIVGSSLHSNYKSASYQIFKEADESDFEIDEEGTITAYNGKYVAIKVPDEINGVVPKTIGRLCFKDSNIKRIELPNSVEIIGYRSFENSNIESIKAEGVTYIYQAAFKNCLSLYEEYMPNVKTTEDASFYNCSLLTDLSFRENLVHATCKYGVVDTCGSFTNTGLRNADFPDLETCHRTFEGTPITYANLPKVKELDGAFKDCKLLTSANIPNVTYIARYAFYNCVSLPKTMDFSKVTSLGYAAFQYAPFEYIDLPNCTELYAADFCFAYANTINLPLVKEFSDVNCSGYYIEHLNIPNVEKFYENESPTFADALGLKEIYAPKATNVPTFYLYTWGQSQVDNKGAVPALEYIYLPNATTAGSAIADFKYCDNLDFIYLPKLARCSTIWLPENNECTVFISAEMEDIDSIVFYRSNGPKYTFIAETDSNAQTYANQWKAQFIPSEELSFDSIDGENFIYSTPDGKTCSMPIKLIEQMWYDYIPINKSPDFMTHGYLIDVVNDNFINGKDFAKIHHTAKYGW